MWRWPVLHIVILIAIICASLLFQVLYFILDVIFLEFTCIPIFYWIIMDICFFILPFYLLLGYYLQKNTLDVTFIVLRKNFVILRVSGWSVNSMYHLWMHMLLFFSQYHLGWVVMQCSYLLHLHYILPFLPHIFLLLFCIIFCQCLSRITFKYCSKFEHSLTPNVFVKSLQLTTSRKLEYMMLLNSQIRWSMNGSFLM